MFLQEGEVIIMKSDPEGARNFQQEYEHCVPKRKLGAHKEPLKGWRLNATLRLQQKGLYKGSPQGSVPPSYRKKLEEGIEVLGWLPKVLISKEDLKLWKQELYTQIMAHGVADKTTVYGKVHLNGGRKVLELAATSGQTYSYGGKTTPAGQSFGEITSKMVADILGPTIFGTSENLWIHLVYYPSPTESGLGWHSDSEEGIDPHCIASVTFLEYPDSGARPFQVRKKKKRKRNKTSL